MRYLPASLTPSAVEEPALQEWQDLLAREGPRIDLASVAFEHHDVVLERLVRALERVSELVALEDEIFGARLIGFAVLGVDGTTDRPDALRAALEPEHDPLLPAGVVHPDEHALGVPTLTGAPLHVPGIQSRLVAIFKNLFSFLFQRSSAEEHVARYVVREHERGRSLDEILQDRYVQNRLTPEQQRRLLDRPEIVGAISGEKIEAAKASVEGVS
ncbi:hypothetical protein BH20ACT14_BH20ACT14_18370 [soil metagenome]